ncbi:MAG: ParB/RepB/Spo0J family partition protein [Methylococcales bacterium]|nr:ParB/RepB/Spo0J family partition protein [Methylococcales bacterium]
MSILGAVNESNLGLEEIGDLSALLTPNSNKTIKGKPLEIPLELIAEDPDQPRKEFVEKRLQEMTESIKERGVKSPISVRNHPEKKGYYFINYGAYRYRGSWRAGKKTIPAFIDDSYLTSGDAEEIKRLRFDQVIENLHRNELSPMEIAIFIKDQKESGMSQVDIAKALNKSKSFITMHLNLIDMPECISEAYRNKRCNDVTLISTLTNLYQDNKKIVEGFLSDTTKEITRGEVKALRDHIEKNKDDSNNSHNGDSDTNPENNNDLKGGESKKERKKKENDPEKMKKGIVLVSVDDRPGRIVTDRRPSGEGLAWVRFDSDGAEEEIEAHRLTVLGIIEG